MAAGEEKTGDFYAVLGLQKECSASDLRNAYKKLALRWHPDRCSSSGNSNYVEEAKKKFQAIQEAYSVLSDANKRFLYDVGIYNSDDDENDMGDFLGEMAVMMSQTKPSDTGKESFEELQELFEEMFQRDSFGSTSQGYPPIFSSSNNKNNNNKRSSLDMNSGKGMVEDISDFSSFDAGHNFCLGRENAEEEESRGARSGSRRKRNGRKHNRVSSRHDMSAQNAKISA
ncbi:chaperone DnaJ-domain superfamily protein isoform X2 [Tasmannia lanceolata]|uniref:chaperone DnaJ-domain superfamily protein isoform X2 n=1 Tax=Tasmannia lanceolata TaxID=3420 RepID=UPI004062EDCD